MVVGSSLVDCCDETVQRDVLVEVIAEFATG